MFLNRTVKRGIRGKPKKMPADGPTSPGNAKIKSSYQFKIQVKL
jgi:hypothetical protein